MQDTPSTITLSGVAQTLRIFAKAEDGEPMANADALNMLAATIETVIIDLDPPAA